LPLDRPYLHTFDAARYPRAFLFGQVSEAQVQADILSAASLMGLHLEVVDAGFAAIRGKFYGAMLRAGIKEPMARLVLKGLTGISAADPGRSDLSGSMAPDGRAVFLEVKAPAWVNPKTGGTVRAAGSPSPEQLAFLDARAREGCIVGVCWSVGDALDALGTERLKAHRRCSK
jgi:hypothetical protein